MEKVENLKIQIYLSDAEIQKFWLDTKKTLENKVMVKMSDTQIFTNIIKNYLKSI